MKIQSLIPAVAALVVVVALALTSCATSKVTTVQGIVQAVDPANNALTLRLDEGSTATFRLDSNTQVKIGERDVNSSYLEPGLSVTAQAKGKAVQLVEIDLAQLEGTIMSAQSSQLILQPLNSPQQLTLKTRPFTIVRQNSVDVAVNALNLGRIARVSFCTASGTAYEVYEMPEGYTAVEVPEGAPLQGVVTKYRFDELTVTPIGGIDRKMLITDATKIAFEDGSPATKNDIYYWDWVTAYFSPSTAVASKIVIRPDSSLRNRK